jgi:hypothetical protein
VTQVSMMRAQEPNTRNMREMACGGRGGEGGGMG